jgi:hypothetical protein
LHFQLDSFREGILASVFDSLDRIQHMFWRDRMDIIETWYGRLDGIVGRVQQSLANKHMQSVNLMVVSDHGLRISTISASESLVNGSRLPCGKARRWCGGLKDVDWSRSRACDWIEQYLC